MTINPAVQSSSTNETNTSHHTNPQVVVVLGMHRSGTSALTKALEVLGVSLSENLMPEGEFNPKGHWEDLDIVAINDKLLAYYGCVWFSPYQPELDLDDPFVDALIDEAVALLLTRIETLGYYGFKDPRTSRLLAFWQAVFARAAVSPKYVYALRNPLDIVKSLQKRDQFAELHGYLLWAHHTFDNLTLLSDQPVYWVPFEALLQSPRKVMAELTKFIALPPAPEKALEAFCQDYIDPTLCHSASTLTDLYRAEHAAPWVIALFKCVQRLSASQENPSMLTQDPEFQSLAASYPAACQHSQNQLFDTVSRAYYEQLAQIHHLKLSVTQHQDDARNRQAELQNGIHELRAALDEQTAAVAERDADLSAIQQQLSQAQRQQRDAEQTIHAVQAELALAQQHSQAIEQAMAEIRHSTSWRLTAPIRGVGSAIRQPKQWLSWLTAKARLVNQLRQQHGGTTNLLKRAWTLYRTQGIDQLIAGTKYQLATHEYGHWLAHYGTPSAEAQQAITARVDSFEYRPHISVLMPVYNPDVSHLEQAIASVQAQLYPHWELCIADDCSTNPEVSEVLQAYAQQDARIKVVHRQQNGHISAASNSALAIASGDFVALMDQDDTLAIDALYWVAETILANPDVALIYSDEDKLTADGNTRYDPNFKPQWNPELIRSMNCVSHLGVYRKAIADEIGGFREGFEGAQDWDFVLRFSEQVNRDQIIHIPRILYHWRAIEGSTATGGDEKPYALLAGIKAVEEHLARQSVEATVEQHPERDYARVRYHLPTPCPLVSLVIPTRNGLEVLKVCIDSILEKTTYPNYDIIIVDNGSDCQHTLSYLADLQAQHSNVRVLRDDSPFNYSALNNKAVAEAKGELVALVNNDVEVITPEWLTELVSHAIQPNVGAVGARLWYPDNTLQHGGVIMVGGVAGHAHKHLPKGQPGYACRAIVAQNYSAVTAACLVVRKSLFEQVGGLNEDDLTVAFNDIDFCLKLKHAGYDNVWTPFAELYHYESKTRGFEDTPEKQARFNKEVTYMQAKWQDILLNDPCYNPNLTMAREDFSLAEEPRV
ncbi:glycosyltransferase [Salinivibrio sp. ML290]|uniref:glycosyltransferase n=1 Tax=Salinivibrio sp. ML290 TaxID=1909468 RepID=UPI00098879C7|nr:glycosyltransferase [Salinivibrio sp. ML290]OOE73698.1 glycosyl transferase family 2 [Salinivibrio sp. ML290]